MGVSVERDRFSGRDEAVALIHADGRTVRDGAMSAGDLEDHHWHRTSLKIYVLSGAFETLDVASGNTLLAHAGDLITIPERTLHAARCPEPATYVVGFESPEAMAAFRPELPEAIDQP